MVSVLSAPNLPLHDSASLSSASASTQSADAAWAYTSQADVVLGGGWDYDEAAAPATPPYVPDPLPLREDGGSSSSASSSSSRSTSPSPTPTSPGGSSSPTTAKESLSSSGLLVRSITQGWERSFDLNYDWPVPAIAAPDEVLIRNEVVGLNPVDFKSILYNFGIPDTPWVLGRDVMGTVQAVGSGVTGFAPGDRVWTCADSRDRRAGAYQTRSVSRAAHLCHLPACVSDDEGATLGTGLVTAAVCAYWFLRLPAAASRGGDVLVGSSRRREELDGQWLLVYGGGAVTGQFVSQLARLSGLSVLAVASPSNFEHLTSAAGVSACVDRHLEPAQQLAQIRELTGGRLRYAVDCVGSSTATLCGQALQQSDVPDVEFIGLAGNPKPAGETRKEIKVHKISFSTTIYGNDAFAARLFADLAALLSTRELLPIRPVVVPHGLAGIRRGLEALRDGTAPRARKLVVRLDETPHQDTTNLGVHAELCWNGVA